MSRYALVLDWITVEAVTDADGRLRWMVTETVDQDAAAIYLAWLRAAYPEGWAPSALGYYPDRALEAVEVERSGLGVGEIVRKKAAARLPAGAIP